jgi:hypothetical protein
MLILYVLSSFKQVKESLLLFFLSLVLSALFYFYYNEYSFFLVFNYFASLIYLFSKFILKKKDTFFNSDDYPISFLINYFLYCFFLIWYILTLFQVYITLSIFDFKNIEFLSFIFLFAIQSRLLFFDVQNKSQLVLNILDFIFISSLLFFRRNDTYLTLIIYFYSFRLFRILTLIPYFDKILSSIWRGFRISFHFVIAFFLIILLLSINSRILFSNKIYSNDFSSMLMSFYNNFKISLGNGFDISSSYSQNNLILFYIISMTFVMGVIFTSIFTALITDGLIKDDDLEDDLKKMDNYKNKWYLKQDDETILFYLIRVNTRIASL